MKVYLALTRPKLKRGAEWKLTTLNGLLALLMLITALWHWWTLIVAALFYWPGQWLLRQAAKHDPQWLAVYGRALRHPLIREPHGYAWTRERRPQAPLPRPPRWFK
ncbi:MAG TPA: VirB3 family type IV secretion system protein [Candidatus Binataceae bacterium]|nr:VirB3 family type IV secretion system protein [Candidatus Binataceae bacterium]